MFYLTSEGVRGSCIIITLSSSVTSNSTEVSDLLSSCSISPVKVLGGAVLYLPHLPQ